jgi:hypothetical protein
MITPTVIEILQRREAVTRDPFIAGLGVAAVASAAPSRRGPAR